MELQDNSTGQTSFQNQLAVNDFAEQSLHFKLYDISNTPSFLNLVTHDHSPLTNPLDHLLTPPPFINLENILEPIFITSLDQPTVQYTAQENDSKLQDTLPDHIIDTRDHIIDRRDRIIDTRDHIIDTGDHIIDTSDHIIDTGDHIESMDSDVLTEIQDIALHELSSDSNDSISFENQSRKRPLEEIVICEESDPDDHEIVDLTQE